MYFQGGQEESIEIILDGLCILMINCVYLAFMAIWNCSAFPIGSILVHEAVESGVVTCNEHLSPMVLCIFEASTVCCYFDLFTSSMVG